ncbi:MAG: protein translocase subunit SecD [Actinobacteria bacterium]|nr:protein translocase subunit SecD [Actinomycetota bacterium]
MNRSRLVSSLVAAVTVVAVLLGWMAGFDARPSFGLDLRGGISVILTPEVAEGEEVNDEVLNRTIEIIRSRVDALGIAEPEIQRQGDDVLVQLPGLEDRERALEVIGRTAKLTFRPVRGVIPPSDPRYQEIGLDCGGEVSTAAPSPSPTATAPGDETSPTAGPDDASPAPTEQVTASGEEPTEAPSPAPTVGEGESPPTVEEPEPEAVPVAPGSAAEDDQALIVCGSARDDPTTAGVDESDEAPPLYEVGPSPLTGEAIDDAVATPEQTSQGGVTNNWVVQLDLTGEGGQGFAEISGQLACERDQGQPGGGRLAIVLDQRVESAPSMNPDVQCGVGITGGSATITVGGQEEEARDLALVLKTGALPITLEPSTFFNVSPTLGAQSLRAGIIAGLLGLGLVALWLTFFYRWLGALAVGGLATFGVIILGLITLLGEVGFALTLAGIAGIIVSIGIAADSSILYFERIRDELETGKTVRTSVVRAFKPAFRTNLTGNTVTIAAAIVLYFLAVGPVRGFAFTLGLSTVLDLLILYFYTRPAVQLLGNTRLLTRRSARVTTEAAGGTL